MNIGRAGADGSGGRWTHDQTGKGEEWDPMYFCTWDCLAHYAMRIHKREREMGFE